MYRDSNVLNSETDQFIKFARTGNLEMVKLFVEQGTSVNAQDFWGDRALVVAVESENIEVIEFLLANGADPNLVNDSGFSAVDMADVIAFISNSEKIVETLRSYRGKDEASKLHKEQNEAIIKKKKLEERLANYEIQMQRIALESSQKIKNDYDRKLIEHRKEIIEWARERLLESKCPACNTIPDSLGRCKCS